jgi:predicted glycosyltransferase
LPSLLKGSEGRYQSKNWDFSLRELIKLRSNIILSTIQRFKPDLMIVDNVPRGACLELDETLAYIKSNLQTKVILGLRDIKDDDQTVMREWRQQKYYEFLREYYTEVWIYGDVIVYDWAQHCYFPEDLLQKIHYLGYLDQCRRLDDRSKADETLVAFEKYQLNVQPYFLCLLGGGQDGYALGHAFCCSTFPVGFKGVLIIGPHMDPEQRAKLHEIKQQNPDLVIFDFLNEPTVLIKEATGVMSMGGYNNVLEILSYEKRAVIVPRIYPRTEQLIRAERLEHLKVVDLLKPDQLGPQSLTDWMKRHCINHQSCARQLLNLNGLENLVLRIDDLLDKDVEPMANELEIK